MFACGSSWSPVLYASLPGLWRLQHHQKALSNCTKLANTMHWIKVTVSCTGDTQVAEWWPLFKWATVSSDWGMVILFTATINSLELSCFQRLCLLNTCQVLYIIHQVRHWWLGVHWGWGQDSRFLHRPWQAMSLCTFLCPNCHAGTGLVPLVPVKVNLNGTA